MKKSKPVKFIYADGIAPILILSVFVLSLTSLIVSVRLLQQNVEGILPGSLLIFAVFGISGSVYALLTADKRLTGVPSAASLDNGRSPAQLQKLVRLLEKQNRNLEEKDAEQKERILELEDEVQLLSSDLSKWRERSLEVFRRIDRIVNGDVEVEKSYVLAMERTKKHFAQLVKPLGVSVIEPEKGDAFDEMMHEVVGEAKEMSFPSWVVVRCVEWGYSVDGKVRSLAKVIISHGDQA